MGLLLQSHVVHIRVVMNIVWNDESEKEKDEVMEF